MSWDIWSSMPEEIANQIASGFIGASRVGGDKWLSKVRLFFIINLTLLWLYPPYTCITLIKNKILIKIPASIMILHLLPLKILTNNAACNPIQQEWTHVQVFFMTRRRKRDGWTNGILYSTRLKRFDFPSWFWWNTMAFLDLIHFYPSPQPP